MTNSLFRGLSLLADERLDPDNSFRETAWEYVEDFGVDATDTSALMSLSMDIMDKLDEMKQSEASKLEGIYQEYNKINLGLMAILFNRFDNECDEKPVRELS